jgi:hypothetical protein
VSVVDDIYYEIAQMKARMSNLVRPARLVSFDPATNKAVADAGDGMRTHPMPLYTQPGHWAPPKAGQQVTILCPDGDLNNGFIVPGGYTQSDARPSTRGDEDVIARGAARLLVREDGVVRAHVPTREKFKLVIDDVPFAIHPNALVPTSLD